MLISISVSNYKSFDDRSTLSMISSGKERGHPDHKTKIKQTTILRNAVVYGANASGKSNLAATFDFVKRMLLEGVPVGTKDDYCRNKEENKDIESRFDILFTSGDSFYAYGFSLLLNEGRITCEWLHSLTQSGNSHVLFSWDEDGIPSLGEKVKLSSAERSRFDTYADDFAGNATQLFLTEMNRGKKYSSGSGLGFFRDAFMWLTQNIIIIGPCSRFPGTGMYWSEESLEDISALMGSFDTGITNIRREKISIHDLERALPAGMIQDIVDRIKKQSEAAGLSRAHATLRTQDGFYGILIDGNSEPEITTLAMRHGGSASEFGFSEESDGTKRLFDLADMLAMDCPDTVFIIDELERSLHPKLTERFLRMFAEKHIGSRTQIVLTTHETALMDRDLFRREEIWFVERNTRSNSHLYSLDRFAERYDTKKGKAYLDGRYGAVPIFSVNIYAAFVQKHQLFFI